LRRGRAGAGSWEAVEDEAVIAMDNTEIAFYEIIPIGTTIPYGIIVSSDIFSRNLPPVGIIDMFLHRN
jgi:hypothetical protein